MTETLSLADLDRARPELLLTDEVSSITRVPAATLRRWRGIGLSGGDDPGPPSQKIGPGRVVYRSDLLLKWIESQAKEDGAG